MATNGAGRGMRPMPFLRWLGRVLVQGAVACCIHLAQVQAAEPAAGNPCEDRLALAQAASGPALPWRLPELRYRCLRLQGGQHLWVGEAGTPQQPAVLLVHGLGNNANRDWVATVGPLLAQGFHVLAVDLPGFGASPPPAQAYAFSTLGANLAELLDRLVPGQRVHVVGHSLGGAVSLYFAHRFAHKVDRLVLVDAAGILLKPVFVQNMASLRRRQVGFAPVDRILGILDERVNGLSRLLFLGSDDRYDFTPWLLRNPDVRLALLGGLTQVDAALNLVEHDFSAAIRETQAPTTVIWGRDDAIAPPRTGQLLAARLLDARLHWIEQAGHTPMQDQPSLFNARLLQALAAPWPAKAVSALPQASQGHVVCRNTDEVRYTGRFESLTLERCGRVRIDNAHLGQLKLVRSEAVIDNSVIDAGDALAVDAQRSELTATGVVIRGRTALRADNSFFDLAGVSLLARERGVEFTGSPSRLFFSVSDWQGSDYRGDAHFIWPRPAP